MRDSMSHTVTYILIKNCTQSAILIQVGMWQSHSNCGRGARSSESRDANAKHRESVGNLLVRDP